MNTLNAPAPDAVSMKTSEAQFGVKELIAQISLRSAAAGQWDARSQPAGTGARPTLPQVMLVGHVTMRSLLVTAHQRL